MTSRSTLLAVVAVAAVGLTGASCTKNGAGPGVRQEPAADAPKAEAPKPDAATAPSAPTAATASPLDGVPGMDFSSLPPSAQKELAAVFTDEFCYCGCPHTLGACLKTHTDCRHAKRMANLAAAEAAAGVPATEIIVLLGKYYHSFTERTAFKVDSRLCLGPADAKVTLVEFSDFECPYCAAAAPLLKEVVKRRSDTRLCFAPFPLKNHPNAMPAAQAALFAREKGKFWEMHDAIFEHQAELSREKLLELAEGLGLPKAELAKVLDSGQYTDELRAGRELGINAGVDHTPSVYVNGRPYDLGLSEEALRHTIDDELEWQANRGWAKD